MEPPSGSSTGPWVLRTAGRRLTAASLSKRAKSSLRVMTSSWAVHWDARLVKPSMSANRMLGRQVEEDPHEREFRGTQPGPPSALGELLARKSPGAGRGRRGAPNGCWGADQEPWHQRVEDAGLSMLAGRYARVLLPVL